MSVSKVLEIKADRCTIGADPEFFVKRNGHFVSAHDFECGTKLMPMQTPHGAIQVDGMALEANVKPAMTRAEFIRNVYDVMGDLNMVLASKDRTYTLAADPVIHLPKRVMDDLPPAALELGCEPDENAYTGMSNPRPQKTVLFRTGSGHLHIGWTENAAIGHIVHRHKCRRLTILLDYYVGLTTLLFDPDHKRRQLYGKAGAHRVKPYGVEYRTPSNKWTQRPQWAGLMFDQAQKAFYAYKNGRFLDKETPGFAASMIDQGNRNWWRIRPEIHREILGS